MNDNKTFSRAYLQGLPEQKKQELFSQIISQFHGWVIQTAGQMGKTSYIVEESVWNVYKNQRSSPPPPSFTTDELVIAIWKRYPDCKVFYDEVWVDTGVNNRSLKKGIVIDWS
jgi:hypothetical protein